MKFSHVQIDMTIDEAKRVQNLLERDNAKPFIRVKTKIGENDYQYDKCPVCDEPLVMGANFCMVCGQRIDTENIAL